MEFKIYFIQLKTVNQKSFFGYNKSEKLLLTSDNESCTK